MRNATRSAPMHTSQLAMRSLELFHSRLTTEPVSSYRMAKMRLIGQMLEMRESSKLASSLAKSPNDLEYYKALLSGPDFTMDTGGKLFERVEKALALAYRQGADLSELLPVLKGRLSATYAVEANVPQAYAALNILGSFLDSEKDGKPSQKEVVKAMLQSAAAINLDRKTRHYQRDIIGNIIIKLQDAAMTLELPAAMKKAIFELM